ncbi:MAG: DUF4390 domain-containing protein [Arenicellales bacterium]|nr:DUF4390 domain-containing protein [Arenicellales bacterium]
MFFQPNSGAARPTRLLQALLLAMLLAGFSIHAHAQFAVNSGQSKLVGGLLSTSARLTLKITGDPAQALSKGIGLTIVVQTRLYRASLASWYFKVANWEQRFRVEHHALSNRYTLTQVATGTTDDFPTLTETLSAIGHFAKTVDLPAGAHENDELPMRLQVSLDRKSLPGPLKLVALIFKDWQLRSSWGRWKVKTR